MRKKQKKVKESFFRFIFNTQFNLSFHKSKKDRCDACEAYKVAKENNKLDNTMEEVQQVHLQEKIAMREEKTYNNNNELVDLVVISFDLQNVVQCPKAEISSFFYKRKLNVYNLTAHVKSNKTIKKYCVVWPEVTSRRTGNDLASGLIKIFDDVAKTFPEAKHYITWSDSCVPQNRNSIMTTAMIYFLTQHRLVEDITMKYSVPGHSAVQDVDNMHSQIEKTLQSSEFYSAISLMRLLLTVNRKKPFTIIQMQSEDFKDFQNVANKFLFEKVPFSNITSLQIKCAPLVGYKVSYSNKMFHTTNVKPPEKYTRKKDKEVKKNFMFTLPKPGILFKFNQSAITEKKKNDLKDMLKFMPLQDKEYYENVIKICLNI